MPSRAAQAGPATSSSRAGDLQRGQRLLRATLEERDDDAGEAPDRSHPGDEQRRTSSSICLSTIPPPRLLSRSASPPYVGSSHRRFRRPADRADRTPIAVRDPGRADQRAELHERLVVRPRRADPSAAESTRRSPRRRRWPFVRLRVDRRREDALAARARRSCRPAPRVARRRTTPQRRPCTHRYRAGREAPPGRPEAVVQARSPPSVTSTARR